MVSETPEPSPARPRVLACARRTALLCLTGLVSVAVGVCWVSTIVLYSADHDIGATWLSVAFGTWLLVLLGVVWSIARVSTRFLEDAFSQEDRMVSAVAHEIRSPVSRVLVSIEEGLCGLTDERTALVEARHEGRALAQLMDDLLLAGQVLAGAVPAPRDEVDVEPLLDSVRGAASLGDATLVVEAAPAVITGSDHLLRLSVVNLVRNAVQHAYGGGPGVILVRADEEGVAVIDDGPGIPDDQLDDLVRRPGLGPPRRRAGLGLQLAEWVAEVHGGQLRLRNRRGGGLEARLVLPVEPVAALNGHAWLTEGPAEPQPSPAVARSGRALAGGAA